MPYLYEAVAIPPRGVVGRAVTAQVGARVAHGQADSDGAARRELATALSSRIGVVAAKEVAAGAATVLTDYPEYGVAVRVVHIAPRPPEATTPSAVSRTINAAGLGQLCAQPPRLDAKTGSILVLLTSTEAVVQVGALLRSRRYRVWTPGQAAMASRMSGYIRVLGRYPQA